MKRYIDKNTELWADTTTCNFSIKIMNICWYGKQMENIRKRKRIQYKTKCGKCDETAIQN